MIAKRNLYKYAISRYKEKQSNFQKENISRFIQPQLIKFFSNVEYLIKKRGWTKTEFKKRMLRDCGFGICIQTITRFKRGQYKNSNVYYLSAYCLVLEVPLHELLSRNFEQEDVTTESLNRIY